MLCSIMWLAIAPFIALLALRRITWHLELESVVESLLFCCFEISDCGFHWEQFRSNLLKWQRHNAEEFWEWSQHWFDWLIKSVETLSGRGWWAAGPTPIINTSEIWLWVPVCMWVCVQYVCLYACMMLCGTNEFKVSIIFSYRHYKFSYCNTLVNETTSLR